ncbi:MAG: glcK 2 [Planctomycetaceae bacterium]|nr:glcK 2 [Planctomycetaceae bacterium]
MAGKPPFYAGIDVGGTNIKAGIVDCVGNPLGKASVPTDAVKGPDQGIASIKRVFELALQDSGLKKDEIRGVGLATPGTMDIPNGMLLMPPNLPGWNYFPVRQRTEDAIGIQTVLQNDANAAAYGEFWAGAAKEAESLVFWTLGTGIGCGIIIGDLIIEGRHSHGAECGHIIVQMDSGRLCGTGQYGTLEAYCGAKALVKRCQEAIDAGRASVLSAWISEGQELTPLLIATAAERGDQLADDLIMETARYMGVGTVTLMHTIDPDMVVFGGAMTFGAETTELGRRFLQEIKDEVKKRAFPIPYAKTILKYASLHNDAGFIGAAGCAKLKFK